MGELAMRRIAFHERSINDPRVYVGADRSVRGWARPQSNGGRILCTLLGGARPRCDCDRLVTHPQLSVGTKTLRINVWRMSASSVIPRGNRSDLSRQRERNILRSRRRRLLT